MDQHIIFQLFFEFLCFSLKVSFVSEWLDSQERRFETRTGIKALRAMWGDLAEVVRVESGGAGTKGLAF